MKNNIDMQYLDPVTKTIISLEKAIDIAVDTGQMIEVQQMTVEELKMQRNLDYKKLDEFLEKIK